MVNLYDCSINRYRIPSWSNNFIESCCLGVSVTALLLRHHTLDSTLGQSAP